jgi:hypothetical protein
MTAREDRKIVTSGRVKVTRALFKFCQDHALPNPYLQELESCLIALEKKDIDLVSRQAKLLGHAGMGSLLDWVPPVKFEHEDSEYVDVVWNALLGHWLESMRVFRAAEA